MKIRYYEDWIMRKEKDFSRFAIDTKTGCYYVVKDAEEENHIVIHYPHRFQFIYNATKANLARLTANGYRQINKI